MAARTESEETSRAILGICSVIRGLLAGASHDEVMTRHQVGEVLCRIRSMPRVYGGHCVERVAEEVGMTPAKLYRHIAVAECWTPADLADRMERTNRFGQPLTWSHLVVLAKVDDGTAREFLLDECLANAWSVRELSYHVSRLAERPAAAAQAGAAGAVHAALKDGIEFGNKAVADVSLFTSMLAARLESVGTDPNPQLVARAIATFQELQARAESALAELRGAAQSEKRLRCTPPAAAQVDGEVSREEGCEDPGELPRLRAIAARRGGR